MVMIETNDWLSQGQFAKAVGMTRQGISKALTEGRLEYIDFSGHKFIHKKYIEEFRKA